MKKSIIIALLLAVPVFLAAMDDREKAEHYFEKGVQYYLEGDLDNSISLITRALQVSPANPKYTALYDMLIEEKENLKVIKLSGRPAELDLSGDEGSGLGEYINSLKAYYEEQSGITNKRVQNLVKALSEETGSLKAGQDAIINEKLPLIEGKMAGIEKAGKTTGIWLSVLIGAILLFISAIIFVIMSASKKLKKAEESLKYLAVRQDEQYEKLGRVEEEQRRLRERNI